MLFVLFDQRIVLLTKRWKVTKNFYSFFDDDDDMLSTSNVALKFIISPFSMLFLLLFFSFSLLLPVTRVTDEKKNATVYL